MGVRSLALFGSTARVESTVLSDVDLLVELDDSIGLFGYYRIQEYLENLLETEQIDLVIRDAVIDELKDRIYAEAIPCL